jgi:hypothetical protein
MNVTKISSCLNYPQYRKGFELSPSNFDYVGSWFFPFPDFLHFNIHDAHVDKCALMVPSMPIGFNVLIKIFLKSFEKFSKIWFMLLCQQGLYYKLVKNGYIIRY